ncbi:hypothetical protein [Staphylococcus xylosus]|uniref:hypothetical protein n=1 Tax=Staphylococcus xylosus TaxID=1288 RepID=UPI003F54FA5B
MAGKRWTDEEIKLLIELNNKKYGYQEIAEQLGRTRDSVAIKMSKLEIPSKFERVGNKGEHIYQVGEIVNDNVLIIEQIRNKQNARAYIVASTVYPNAPYYEKYEYDLKNGGGCAYVRGLRVCPENSLWGVEKSIRPYVNKEDALKVTKQSGNPINVSCEICGVKKKTIVSDLVKRGMICLCNTGVSYGNLAFGSYNAHFKLGFESEKILHELPNRRVDFINWDNGMWIEIQGDQHTNKNHIWYESAHEQDLEKREFAKNNSQYNLIEIDMRVSSWEYFKEQINNCEFLPNIKEMDEKEILKLIEINSKYPIETIKYMYEVEEKSSQKIANELNLSVHVIKEVLKKNNVKMREKGTIRASNVLDDINLDTDLMSMFKKNQVEQLELEL